MSKTPRTDALERQERHNNMAETMYWFRQYKILSMELERDNARLRAELEAAVQVIRGWHGMGMDKDLEQRMWEIYWNDSPEMKRIQAALA